MTQTGAPAQNWAGARVLVLSPTPTHPQDFGNRKRIFEICRRLSSQRAHITFVHYPSEQDWRGSIPLNAERAMVAAWSQYYAVAPTRPLHTDPLGRHHTIDEWWDPAIESFLCWLFSVQTFDVFIVNYSWLSRALEFAPASVFKILDTHDKLSGRRDLLESLGVGAEFFYTTEAQEEIALNRADLVWAIKDQERAEFERMTATPVLTMLHADPFRPLVPPAPDPEGYLRVGIIGARNNVNRINITRFLKAAEPVFRELFAPVKLVIAGSVCRVLGDVGSPFVELRGAVNDVEDFYRSVDCVAIPVEISTGLKIKMSEAVSFGVPVVSTAHAFEGFASSSNLHGLGNFTELARALADLAFAPRAELDALAAASRHAHAQAAAQIDKAFRKSAAMMREYRRTIVVAVDSRALIPDSIFNLALSSIYERFRDLANLTVLVASGSAEDVVRDPAMIDRFRRVVVGRDIAGAGHIREEIMAAGAEVCDTTDFLLMARPVVVIADALNPAMFAGSWPETVVVARTELIALSEGSAEFRIPGARYSRAFAMAPGFSLETSARLASSGAEPLLEPCFWPFGIDLSLARGRRDQKAVVLLGTPRAPAMTIAARMAQSWELNPVIVYGVGEQVPTELDGIACIRADAYGASLLKGAVPQPGFAVDLSAGMLGIPLCRELLERLHVPTVSTMQAGLRDFPDLDMLPFVARTEGELWRTFRSFATESRETHERRFAGVWRDLDNAHSWSWLWRYCSRLVEDGSDQFA